MPLSLADASAYRHACLQPRAKAMRKHVDHMIQLSKDGSLHARRQVPPPSPPSPLLPLVARLLVHASA